MNFTDSPFERMMKQVPRPCRGLFVTPGRFPLPELRVLERCALRRHLLPEITSFAEGGDFGPSWSEVKHMETVFRELTRDERASIRRQAMGMCANYD